MKTNNENINALIANFIALQYTVDNIEDIVLYDAEADCEIRLIDIIKNFENEFN